MYARFAWGLRSFLRHPISLQEARAIVQRRMAERDTSFLRLVERGIFGHRQSPYRAQLELAGCQLGDIRNMVRALGLEGTLRALREAGVYVTFEEFKGYQPIVRNGHVIPVQAGDFDNPHLKLHYQSQSSGSTGAGTRVPHDLDHLAAQASQLMITSDAYGVLGVPTAMWRGILPDGSGINFALRGAHYGQVPRKWFSPVMAGDMKPSVKYRLATQYVVIMGRLYGVPFPWPEFVGMDNAIVVARWAIDMVKAHGKCLILSTVSRALRVCIAASENGLDLKGTVFIIGGEPLTKAKVREITRAGATYFPNYFFAEAGAVGMGCCRPVDASDVHVLKDAFAVIQSPRQVPGTTITVPAFNVTSLLPTAPKLLLNVEIDDYGVMEERSCGCPLEAYGYTDHLRDIYSFRKLTGEGVTLVGSEMVRILEEVLPGRFGGSALDYQLQEEEDNRGFTRLLLIVSPKIENAKEQELIETVLDALRQGSAMADSARAIWEQARTLQVKRVEPLLTARGKLMPLHLARHKPASAM
jgi:phenylacetate-coenzyme A ligase PaaK-like adenylate-forming protein